MINMDKNLYNKIENILNKCNSDSIKKDLKNLSMLNL